MFHFHEAIIHHPNSSVFKVKYCILFGRTGKWVWIQARYNNNMIWADDIIMENGKITWNSAKPGYYGEPVKAWRYPAEAREYIEKLYKLKVFW